jgi:hypothetical protein
MKTWRVLGLGALLMGGLAAPARALDLVTWTTPGYYNNALGTVLDGTSACFPAGYDPSATFPTPPDLSAAALLLGGWLASPPVLPTPWWSAAPVSIPGWGAWTETAIVYPFTVADPGAVGVTAYFAVDNGVFAWIDGDYLGGAMDPGGPYYWEYGFPAPDLAPGLHYLQVLREDHGGATGYDVWLTGEPGAVTTDASEQPAAFRLAPAWPNPFNPSTTIGYELAETAQVRLHVFDVGGRLVATLADGLRERGAHQVAFDATGLPSGLYFYTLAVDGERLTRSCLLMK